MSKENVEKMLHELGYFEEMGMKRFLEGVNGKIMVDYEQALAMAEANGFGDDLVKLGEVVDPEVVITPTYMTNKAVGADAFASEDVVIEPWTVKAVPIGIKAKFDGDNEGLFAFIRSSIPGKKEMLLANGVGVIEEDYYGNPKNDGELGFMFLNFSSKPVTIRKFERIGQLILTPILRFENAGRAGLERGASGSTGK
jgi:dUTP pyrophosphatase